ncbi:hypothetical protein LTR70_001602 [Exophiala xenobiotica]|uniref:Uncharacterized protein n=1 Tax=Lithohypha guttulata TaxID=1690604 RepID=A0ABR0K6U1_9EURO|nr:hypothetical protein LTR24_006155 [Lithohypha guttulata]KAK5327128.1 hypothetical protein LTR70_001602 [Exophiala xenobiotica]
MSDFKGIMKGGWHPKGKDGGKESWRGDFKGINQVAGWMGKGKSSEAQAAQEHVSRPLATLKDPSAFGPPPKNVNYHGGAALPNEITPHRGGLGAPLTPSQISGANSSTQSVREQEEEQPERPSPALPYRADRTGLKTDNLPPPPVHRGIRQGGVLSPPARSPAAAAQPRLPPRLPSRQNTTSPPADDPPPPSYDTVATQQPASTPYINQSAVNRLGNAGISVPGLGIGKQTESNPWTDERSYPQSSGTNQMSQLQSRVARMNTPSQETGVVSPSPIQAQSPSQSPMPSWKQSQSAFQTASTLRSNPQNVTLADAQSAAQTAGQAQRSASAFKEKHADSIASAQTKAKAWDQKYKVTSKLNKFLDEHSESTPAQQQQHVQQPHLQQQYQNGQQYPQPMQPSSAYSPVSTTPHYPTANPLPVQPSPPDVSASISRKPPPPPAPRKPANLQAPPPVPTGTKPSFG